MPKKDLACSMLFYCLIGIVLISCSPAYYRFTGQYENSRQNREPDYTDLYYWASHPAKADPADSVPGALCDEPRDTVADVFFIHPTTYTGTMSDGLNADINNPKLNAKTDYGSILYQASAFNRHARIFAPRYRQAHISCFFMQDTAAAKAAFDTAYRDVKTAFLYYINHENHGRPFFIVAHSQGTIHAGRIIRELVESSPLKHQLIAAYLPGIGVPDDYFAALPPCENDSSTGCFVSWRTFRSGHIPRFVKKERFKAVVTNPLTWKTTAEPATREMNPGAILFDFNTVIPYPNDARVAGNILWVHKPRFPGSFLYLTPNYHVGDINLFYLSIRRNAEARLRAMPETNTSDPQTK